MKYLLSPDAKQYKANLHAHSTVSDGALTPSELRVVYKSQGYSIICLTDHEVMVDHSDLSDSEFLFLKGYEMAFSDAGRSTPHSPTCHLSLIAKSPKVVSQVCFDPARVYKKSELLGQISYEGDIFFAEYTVDCVNTVLTQAREGGFFTILNHVCWSLERPCDYTLYNGLGGIEIYNHMCRKSGSRDETAEPYEAILGAEQYILPIASDDNHNAFALHSPESDSFGGFEVICSPSLEYESIIEALESGQAYASTGPMIHTLYMEDGYIVADTTPVREIALLCDARPNASRQFAIPGTPLTHGAICLPQDFEWIRLEVVDFEGHRAWTRAYRKDEI